MTRSYTSRKGYVPTQKEGVPRPWERQDWYEKNTHAWWDVYLYFDDKGAAHSAVNGKRKEG